MFIVIYKEGSQLDGALTKPTYELASALPGDKYIFEYGLSNSYVNGLNVPHGLWFNNAGSNTPFIHGDYQLTNLINNATKRSVDFVFRYKNEEDIVMNWNLNHGGISHGLTYAVKEIMQASRFSSWADYQKHSTTLDEIEELKNKVTKLEVENEKLHKKLATQKKRNVTTKSAKS